MKKSYTRTGDGGETSLIGGKRVSKSDVLVAIYGSVDELAAFIGVLYDVLDNAAANKAFLLHIQKNLLRVEAFYASEMSSEYALCQCDVICLEKQIDVLSEELEPLNSFIIPGGNLAASYAHVCRTVCRRCERLAARIDCSSECLRYLNRLSDYFFVLSRLIQKTDTMNHVNIWKEK